MDFYKERWREKYEEEHPEIKKESRYPKFFDLEKMVKGNELLEKLLDELKESCLRYAKTRERLSGFIKKSYNTKLTRQEMEERVRADHERRIAHNALVDSLNILSRNCAKLGVDNSWREKFYSKEAIGDWAVKIEKEIKELEKLKKMKKIGKEE